MEFVLFEDGGKFMGGREMSQTPASSQVELESGRRVKVKDSHIVLRFKAPSPTELINNAQLLAEEVDPDLIWEFSPEGDFSFIELAKEYYDEDVTPVQQAALLYALFGAPHYFRRMGKGRFKKAPEEQVKAALIAIERKEREQEQVDQWAQELVDGSCPEPIREQLYKILFKPDKNALEYKAVAQAGKQSQKSVLELFKKAGAIGSAYQFHWQRFLFEYFPKGYDFPNLPELDLGKGGELPAADVKPFSIDDSLTTEIDDALSVQGLGSGKVTVGVHIAVPSLGIEPDQALDQLLRQRLSTVYMPGWKIPMLPQNMVNAYSLDEGHERPALSLYLTYDENSLELESHTSRLERIQVAENIRYDQVEEQLNVETLTGEKGTDHPFISELSFLFKLVQRLKERREEVRGKPELFLYGDYTFSVQNEEGEHLEQAPLGDERISIKKRERGAPLDLITAEMMIVANTLWGGLMASVGVPGIYRSQYALKPGVKVRMSTKALPHAGIGVPQYIWGTSPLRRYVDLVNQWQIIACVEHGTTAALVAPFKPKDVALLSIISAFESTYSGYNQFQRGIERYWTFQYLKQNSIEKLEAMVMKNGMLRATDLPLVFDAVGAENHAKDTVVLVKFLDFDDFTLNVSAQVEEVLQNADQMQSNNMDDDSGEDDAEIAGPLSFAVEGDVGSEADAAQVKRS